MSLFHNELPAERLAIGWHAAGLFQSLMKAVFALALAYMMNAAWNMMQAKSAALITIMGAFAYLDCLSAIHGIFWLAWAGVVIGLGGVFWHTWALIQHRDHIRSLRAE